MKIDSGSSYLFANRAQTNNWTALADGSASFAAMLAGKTQEASNASASSSSVKQVDFSNMTRQEMRERMNEEIISGNMTLDESSPLMLMTLKMPDSGGGEIPAVGDNERIDFTRKARLGIDGALSRNDSEAAKRLQAALDLMLKNQGQAAGIDTRA